MSSRKSSVPDSMPEHLGTRSLHDAEQAGLVRTVRLEHPPECPCGDNAKHKLPCFILSTRAACALVEPFERSPLELQLTLARVGVRARAAAHAARMTEASGNEPVLVMGYSTFAGMQRYQKRFPGCNALVAGETQETSDALQAEAPDDMDRRARACVPLMVQPWSDDDGQDAFLVTMAGEGAPY